jgi:hypothetical protein
MERFISKLEENILRHIRDVEKMECRQLQKSRLIIPQLEKDFEGLKSFIANYSFKDEREEIVFFKEVKPRLFSRLIYCYNVYNIEIMMPADSPGDKKEYLKRIQDGIRYFFDMNMGNIFQIYGDIRKRKGDRTEYLNRMVNALSRRMDEDDNK